MARSTPFDLYRNVGIMAHIDAGKTTTTERVLYYTGKSTRSAKCTMVQRRWTGWSRSKSAELRLPPLQRRLSGAITASTSSIRRVTWTSPLKLSARSVLDGAVAVFEGVAGVEPQSETVWRQADKYGVPRICFINKLDRLGADFLKSAQTIEDRLGATALICSCRSAGSMSSRAWSIWSR